MAWWNSQPTADGTELWCLKYASNLLVDAEQNADPVLASVLASALKNNPAKGITGMLYYDRATQALVQVLEGPKGAVMALFDIIVADSRHSGITVLEEKPIAARTFAEFGMALTRTHDAAQLQELAEVPSGGVAAFPEHLIRLQYKSTLVAETAEQARLVVRDIVATAVRKNPELRIGGLLCFNPSSLRVVQVLEGPAAAVRGLFLTIMADTRHADCCLISEELLLSKGDYLFGASWGMMQSETTLSLEAGLLELPARMREAYHAQAATKALEESDQALGVGTTPIASFSM